MMSTRLLRFARYGGNHEIVAALLCVLALGCGTRSTPRDSATAVSHANRADSAAKPALREAASPAPTLPPAKPRLLIRPENPSLRPEETGIQLLAWEVLDNRADSPRDRTASVKWVAEPADAVAISSNGYVQPIQTQSVQIQVHLKAIDADQGAVAETTLTIPARAERPWSFADDVTPLLTRFGCNLGGCHGKSDGQNGFHLSFLGYDSEGDFLALTRDLAERRINPINPEASLLLLKASGQVSHLGGQRFAVDSTPYRTLLAWIKDGAPQRRGSTASELVEVLVEPPSIFLDGPGEQQLRVLAREKSGQTRDVTRLASFRTLDDTAAVVDELGSARLLKRAETDLIVRYGSFVVPVRIASPINPDLNFDYSSMQSTNEIDKQLLARLERLKVPLSPPAPDAVFLRRAMLDLTGEQPSPDQIREYVRDTNPEKRAALVDRLLGSREFVLFWRIKFGDMLQITTARQNNGSSNYQAWVDEQLVKNTPWDQVVKTLLTAIGDPAIKGNGPVNYAVAPADPKEQAEAAAQRFLGLRLRCAQCHDHPFDVWRQDDYFGLAACFAKVGLGMPGAQAARMGRPEIRVLPDGQVEHLRTKKPASARLLDGEPVQLPKDADPRQALATWMTDPKNPFFARAFTNWTWAQFFGKGIADPPDDLSRANPPVHPALLDALARHFIEHRFDIRDLIRLIATSEAYALDSAPVTGNERDTRLFSHHLPRPLTAHQMADALAQATDIPNRFPNQPAGKRAIEIADPTTTSTILDTFGRCPRTSACSSVATPALSLRQALLLIGGDAIDQKVTALNGYLSNLLDLEPEPESIVENLYLRTVCRFPNSPEQAYWIAELKSAKSLRDASEDLFWALLNSREFAFNH